MTRPEDALRSLELSLEQFELDSRWQGLHLVEFDLRGELNPSEMLDRLFFHAGDLPGFVAFCDEYIAQHFQKIKNVYSKLVKLGEVGDEPAIKEIMGSYAYDGFRKNLTADVSDAELEQHLRARLYRTLAGIYTEYHGYSMTLELLGSEKVIRNIALDKKGIDFRVKINKRIFNIHVVIERPKATAALREKIRSKNVAGAEGIHVILPYGIHGNLPESTRETGKGFHIFRKSYIMGFVVAMQFCGNTDEILIYGPGKLSPFSRERDDIL